jgi:tRNA pseudouridine55 synthase
MGHQCPNLLLKNYQIEKIIVKYEEVNGVLLFNKPLGLSSNTALQKVRRLFNAQKAGHTGTLDPLATGLLPICFGEATKFSSFLLDGDKEYIATIKLGQTTTTYDAEGEITSTAKVSATQNQILECINSFLGTITQTPPIYSALKVNGKALYQYARDGEEVVIKSREICIYEIELLEYVAFDVVKIRVLSSKGTYIRTLANDIGQKLGCGAHLMGLVRTKSNQFELNDELSMEYITSLELEQRRQLLLPVDIMLSEMPKYELNEDDFRYIRNGHSFMSSTCNGFEKVRLYKDNQFFGVAKCFKGLVTPIRLMNTSCYQNN